MSATSFDDVLTLLLDVHDHNKLLKVLIDVRKSVDVDCSKYKENFEKIRTSGAFKQIIASLQMSKKSVINVSLSILGNCCLDDKCANEVIRQYNILSNLNHLLKRYPKEDSINGRIFRIIGNLCQHADQWAMVIVDKKPQIVIHIVKYLNDSLEENSKASEATITMGLRALRELLNKETLESLVVTYSVLKTVGALLIKHGAIWQNTKKSESIVMTIVKLLYEYSRYRFYPSISELRNTSEGDSVVYLSKILLISPRQVVKIVMNFLRIIKQKSDLPVSDIFNSFVELIRSESIIQEFNPTCEEYVKCICQLLQHPGNRENERCGESIPLLINVLKDLDFDGNRKIESSLLILLTLNRCKYNQNLINKQLNCNIVSVINDKLKCIVGNLQPLTITHKCTRKRGKSSRTCSSKKGRFDSDNVSSESSNDDENEYFYSTRFDYSPASSNESELAMSWTSGLSPQASPRSQIFGISGSDSDDYSPVCSEVDPSEFPLTPDEDFTNTEPDSKSNEIVQQSDEIGEDLDHKKMKMKVIIQIVELIKTFAEIKPVVAQLGSPDLLLALVKGSGYFNCTCSSAICDLIEAVLKILECHDHLLPLMQSDFIPLVYEIGKHKNGDRCWKCSQYQRISNLIMKKVSAVSESGGGKGDIANKLLRGSESMKEKLVLVIPYIIRNKSILVKFMLNCGGLSTLTKLLQTPSPLQSKSIKALCVLAAKKLCIPNPRKVATCAKLNTTPRVANTSLTTVTFRLDDGSLITTERDFLGEKSDFFARLLNGDFRESREDVITLPNVTTPALKMLLQLMRGEDVTGKSEIGTYLDVIGLCDRFLMDDCRGFMTDFVERERLSFETVPVIYNWALESKTNLLRVECIAFALVGEIEDSERFEMFNNLFSLGYNEELVRDIKELLERYMTISQISNFRTKYIKI